MKYLHLLLAVLHGFLFVPPVAGIARRDTLDRILLTTTLPTLLNNEIIPTAE